MSFAVSFLSSDCLLVGIGADESVAMFGTFPRSLDWLIVGRELVDSCALWGLVLK